MIHNAHPKKQRVGGGKMDLKDPEGVILFLFMLQRWRNL